ncbi:hypothetical protein TNCV_3063951 [Trichonephila clavipes]|nr:hypothetical protein TNCV_3063951 [Trichonephila clavipes]
MDLSSLTFEMFNYKPIGTRTRDRPKLRWADCVEDDFKVLRVTNWRTVAKWRLKLKKAVEKTLISIQGFCINKRRNSQDK